MGCYIVAPYCSTGGAVPAAISSIPPPRPRGAATIGGGRVPRTHKAVCPEPGHRVASVLPLCSESAGDTRKPRGNDEHEEGNLCWPRLSGHFSITAATDGSVPFAFNAIALRAVVFFFARVSFGFRPRFAPPSDTFPGFPKLKSEGRDLLVGRGGRPRPGAPRAQGLVEARARGGRPPRPSQVQC